ncbi:MAG: class I SAM-dependent rRNA methyltransferase, partial [Planctomycetota bacterium]|nr:class I SAM-dependent rRNA methyltransferase [Planctomycetota bacterium]
GLVVDYYPPFCVVQFLATGMEKRREDILDVLKRKTGLNNIFERSDGNICRYEGLPERRGLIAGDAPPEHHQIEENGFQFCIDIERGHKTGYYLDQSQNRNRAAELAQPGRVLDTFCYTGALGIHAARNGAEVIAIDESAASLQLASKNAALNGLDENRYRTLKASAVQAMRGMLDDGERFETVILDPPKFAHSRPDLEAAERGYREVNRLGLQLVAPDGLLFTCSCSGAVSVEMFEELLHSAAYDAGRDVAVLEIRGQSADHPVTLACPESRYLKCFVCRVS